MLVVLNDRNMTLDDFYTVGLMLSYLWNLAACLLVFQSLNHLVLGNTL